MIFLHRLKSLNPRERRGTEYFIPRNHILHTPFDSQETEKYREYFYKQIRKNPEFKEAAHEMCWIYVDNNRLDIYTTTTGEEFCWINVLKEYVFDMYRKWLKQEKGKCP